MERRHRHEILKHGEMEIWGHEHGDMYMEAWTWGQIQNGKLKNMQFSLISLLLLIVQTEVCCLPVC
jgi:hypothetical protein